ncbi:lycopene beta-cyclase CrtY [Altererythrobacter lutimaris]|uniref:Lycopene beta-cyclase CrtY n=1 Tax=Altererythrobacter lutimaris TaxID=2743979 RepID=A0A850HF79_9SPHN|nr:lycopene beta-cyclase CrtY [Altererythrobacter lutimaris]NVE95921.1 lycopene beta-cyclase CrtY [Altererythrobacter lutimaris]
MSERAYDVAIAGGGLAGGLIALALHRRAPDVRFIVLEAGEVLGGNHRWSWFETDLGEDGDTLLASFAINRWDEGYDIAFPKYEKTLETSYRSLTSEEFHRKLIGELPAESVRFSARVEALDDCGITLAGGERIEAKRVVDCRTFKPSAHLAGGWQVFLGQHIQCDEPHGLTRPVIMDATVDQIAPHGNGSAYRFVYVLPLSETEVFVEDTYYADHPKMDKDQLWSRTQAYATRHGWHGEVMAHETGILPVLTGGDLNAALADRRVPGVAMAGAQGGFSHPLTSYTLPFAVENALAIAELLKSAPSTTANELATFCQKRADAHWRRTGFYRLLSRMLFEAANPEERVVVFQHFYDLSDDLVERFYAGGSTWSDKVRILSGEPPVPISRAIKALLSRGTPLSTEKPA